MEQWGSQWFNPSSRVVLIKLVLSSLAIYHNSIFLTPIGITKQIDSLQRIFLWQGGKIMGKISFY